MYKRFHTVASAKRRVINNGKDDPESQRALFMRHRPTNFLIVVVVVLFVCQSVWVQRRFHIALNTEEGCTKGIDPLPFVVERRKALATNTTAQQTPPPFNKTENNDEELGKLNREILRLRQELLEAKEMKNAVDVLKEPSVVNRDASAADISLKALLLGQFRRLPDVRGDLDGGNAIGRSPQSSVRQEITYVVRRGNSHVGVTDLVMSVHGSMNKVQSRLADLTHRWNGPISCAVYIPTEEEIDDFVTYVKNNSTDTMKKWVTYHVLLEKKVSSLQYPVNSLRNLAQNNIESDFFLLMDMDFVPSQNAYKELSFRLVNPKTDFLDKLQKKTIFVLPAFERFAKDDGDGYVSIEDIPLTKKDLSLQIQRKQTDTFHSYFFPGHTPTNYSEWWKIERDATEFSYPISYKKRFEPYVIASRHGIPQFWPGYRGFGYNAAAWHWELDFLGFKYEVVRNHFVVHRNHPGREERVLDKPQEAEIQRFFKYLLGRYNVTRKEIYYWRKYLKEY